MKLHWSIFLLLLQLRIAICTPVVYYPTTNALNEITKPAVIFPSQTSLQTFSTFEMKSPITITSATDSKNPTPTFAMTTKVTTAAATNPLSTFGIASRITVTSTTASTLTMKATTGSKPSSLLYDTTVSRRFTRKRTSDTIPQSTKTRNGPTSAVATSRGTASPGMGWTPTRNKVTSRNKGKTASDFDQNEATTLPPGCRINKRGEVVCPTKKCKNKRRQERKEKKKKERPCRCNTKTVVNGKSSTSSLDD